MFKEEYIRMNEKIYPDPALNAAVLEKVTPRRRKVLRPAAAIAAALVVAMLAVPVTAAYVPAISDLMYQVSPEMAARFTPIQESCTKNGIRMEVVSASIHGATAEICISFEDLEGDRISAATRMEDDELYGINPFISGSMAGGYGDCAFDEETGKLILVIDRSMSFYSEAKGHYLSVDELFDGKMTVSVDELYQYTGLPAVEIPVEMTENEVITVQVERGAPTDHVPEVPFDGFGCASSSRGDPWLNLEEYDLLMPGEAVYEVTEEVAFTGMAYIDGRLHIQTRLRAKDRENSPSYSIWFVDSEWNTLDWNNQNTFVIEEGDDWGSYEEAIYDISQEELAGLTLMCQVEERKVIEGPWRVTFPITESDYEGERDDGVPLTETPDGYNGEWIEE